MSQGGLIPRSPHQSCAFLQMTVDTVGRTTYTATTLVCLLMLSLRRKWPCSEDGGLDDALKERKDDFMLEKPRPGFDVSLCAVD